MSKINVLKNLNDSFKSGYESFKNWSSSIENEKVKAFFSKISPLEYLLMCLPFSLSYIISFGRFPLTIAIFMILLSFFYLFGLRWRIFYFCILLYLAIFTFFNIGTSKIDFWLWTDQNSVVRTGIETLLRGGEIFKKKTPNGWYLTPLPFTYFFYLPVYLLVNDT